MLETVAPSIDRRIADAAAFMPSISLGCDPCELWFNIGLRSQTITLQDPVDGSPIVLRPGFGFSVPYFSYFGLSGSANVSLNDPILGVPSSMVGAHHQLHHHQSNAAAAAKGQHHHHQATSTHNTAGSPTSHHRRRHRARRHPALSRLYGQLRTRVIELGWPK